MGTMYEKTTIGRQLAKYRKLAGFKTAQELANRVADLFDAPTVTRATIVNLELGRKRDATTSELWQLSRALQVAPVALIVDPQDPFGQWNPALGSATNLEVYIEFLEDPWVPADEDDDSEDEYEDGVVPVAQSKITDRDTLILQSAMDFDTTVVQLNNRALDNSGLFPYMKDMTVDQAREFHESIYEDLLKDYKLGLLAMREFGVTVPEKYLHIPSKEDSWQETLFMTENLTRGRWDA